MRSFRSRLILASFFWTAGLLGVAHFLSILLMRYFPAIRHVSHAMMLGVSLALMAVGFVRLRRALSLFDALRARLGAVRDGSESRVTGEYPSEVQPLVNDLNALLEHRERAVRRALATAGDLAHGLKTPLAVLMQESEHAPAIREQVERMHRQIEYHLAHARAAGSGAPLGARCAVRESAEGLARTMRRLHAERGVTIDVQVPAEHLVRVERADLDELLGNLLDNACKWARSRVVVTSSIANDQIAIEVDDDGPGLDPSMREAVLQRGVRADEAAPGSGLGLAIVRDLVELYGGSIALESAPLGGLRAAVRLPRA